MSEMEKALRKQLSVSENRRLDNFIEALEMKRNRGVKFSTFQRDEVITDLLLVALNIMSP
jgi:hypothetical protein